LDHRLSKHEMARYAGNLGVMAPPWLRLWRTLVLATHSEQLNCRDPLCFNNNVFPSIGPTHCGNCQKHSFKSSAMRKRIASIGTGITMETATNYVYYYVTCVVNPCASVDRNNAVTSAGTPGTSSVQMCLYSYSEIDSRSVSQALSQAAIQNNQRQW